MKRFNRHPANSLSGLRFSKQRYNQKRERTPKVSKKEIKMRRDFSITCRIVRSLMHNRYIFDAVTRDLQHVKSRTVFGYLYEIVYTSIRKKN
jgi:hypothetical protein